MNSSKAMLDLLKTRRSVPPLALAAPGPTADELQTILALAARVPDHGKLTPWRFLVFADKARDLAGEVIVQAFRADNPDADAERLAIERTRLSRAPLVVGVVSRAAPHSKIPEWEQMMSAGAVCMNLIIAANALGFATAWLTEWYAYDRRVLAKLGLSPSERMAGFIHVGRALARPDDRARPVMADVTRYFAG